MKKMVLGTCLVMLALAACGGRGAEPEQEALAITAAGEGTQEQAVPAVSEEDTNTDAEADHEGEKKEAGSQGKAVTTAEEAQKEAALDNNGDQKSEGAEGTRSKEADGETKEDSALYPEEAVTQETAEEEAEAEEPALPGYTVTAFEEVRVMYATNSVNVRLGPATDFERVGGLSRGQEVTVTGQADTEWYEILLGEEKAYVSNHYLQSDKPAEEPPAEPTALTADAGQAVQPVAEVKNVAGVILVGDSRFVQMQENAGANTCTWIAENAKGYQWFHDTAVPRIDGCVGNGSKILINLGVNDTGNVNNYLELVNAKAAEWVSKGAKVYYASVNPVWENPYVTEEQVEYFNTQLKGGLSSDIHWIDSHSYLDSIGYKLVDGLHYNAETYQNLYAYFMSCL